MFRRHFFAKVGSCLLAPLAFLKRSPLVPRLSLLSGSHGAFVFAFNEGTIPGQNANAHQLAMQTRDERRAEGKITWTIEYAAEGQSDLDPWHDRCFRVVSLLREPGETDVSYLSRGCRYLSDRIKQPCPPHFVSRS